MEFRQERPGWETELAQRLARIDARYRHALEADLDRVGDPALTSRELVRRWVEEQQDELFWGFFAIFGFAYGALWRFLGRPRLPTADADDVTIPGEPAAELPPDPDRPGRRDIELPPMEARQREDAEGYADQQATVLSDQLQDTNRRRLADVYRRATDAGDEPDYGPTLDELLPGSTGDQGPVGRRAENRNERIAITETTRVIAAGEAAVADRIEAELRRRITKIWHTQRDERVCPICQPLDGTTEAVFGPVLGGPPAHVRCRCWLTYRLGPVASAQPDLRGVRIPQVLP